MKTGILTFHKADNYGAFLQCLALQEYLKGVAADVAVIDYVPSWMSGACSPVSARDLKIWYPRRFFSIPGRISRHSRFKKAVEEHLALLPPGRIGECSCIVVGSDQVWNPLITGGTDNPYWGKGTGDTALISYAASFGSGAPSLDWQKAASDLGKFKAVSVREGFAARLLEERCSIPSEVLPDPTLLLSKESWESRCPEKLCGRDYLFFYQAKSDAAAMSQARALAGDMGLEFVCLSADPASDNTFRAACPFEFLSLVKNASYVVSSSFHGSVFACIFHRPFASVALGPEGDARISDFLASAGLSDRLFSTSESLVPQEEPDWDSVDRLISAQTSKAAEWLGRNLA